jgi:hypothetical protein
MHRRKPTGKIGSGNNAGVLTPLTGTGAQGRGGACSLKSQTTTYAGTAAGLTHLDQVAVTAVEHTTGVALLTKRRRGARQR